MNTARRHPAQASAAADAAWQLRLLGDVQLRSADGQLQRLAGRAPTVLLARLALSPGQAQPREALIDLLWPGVALGVGRNRLRQLLSTLKALLQPVLQADRLVVRLDASRVQCDAAAFDAAARAGRSAEALALYRGELLPGFYDEWVLDERSRLAALADRLQAARPASAPGAAAPPPGRALAGSGLHLPHYLTRLHGVLGAGGAGARLRAAVLAHRLVTLLGPGGFGKTRLAVEVARGLAPGGADTGAPWAPRFDLVAFVPLVACQGADARPEAVLAALLAALQQDHAAAQPLQPLPWLQAVLAGRRSLLVLDNFEQLVDAAAPVLADLLAHCPGLHLLVTSRRALGLDGEHVQPLAALPLPALPALQPGQPPAGGAGVAGVAGVAGAADAAGASPALDLFVDRARAVRPDFTLTAANRGAVVALVRHLQGMPLAIELAATWVRSLGPADLLALLQPPRAAGQAGNSSLALLARSGPRAGGDARHASMLAVLQWSWALLSPPAQRLLPRLAVFAGSFSLAAVQALAEDSATEVALALDELVAHSMLRAEAPADSAAATPAGHRFQLFELVREFAAGLLPAPAAAALRGRQRRWLAGWLGSLGAGAPLQQVRAELPNLAAALVAAQADAAPGEAAALLLAAQPALSAISLPQPGLAALGRCAAALHDPVLRAVVHAALARHCLVAGQPADAARLADLALALLPPADAALAAPGGAGARAAAATGAPADAPPAGAAPAWLTGLAAGLPRALVLTRVAHVRWRLARDPAAAGWLREAWALAAAQGAGQEGLQAGIATNLGAVLRSSDPAQALQLQRQAIALWQHSGDLHGVGVGRCNLALALLQRRAGCAEALAWLDEVLADTLAAGNALQHAQAANLRGEALARLGRWADAAGAYQRCVATAWAAAEPWPLLYGLWNLPRAWAHLRRPEAAARLMGFAQAHARRTQPGAAPSRADRHDLRRLQRLCQGQAAAADVARWWADGAALPLAQAVQLALQGAEGPPP